MADIESKVPDIGSHGGVPVIELLVAVGDTVKKDQGLVTLESDKATMEVPAIADGVIKALKVKLGDSVSEGAVIAVIESGAAASLLPSGEGARRADEGTQGGSEPSPAAAQRPLPAGEVKSSAPAPQAATASGRNADIECPTVAIGAGPGGYTSAYRSADPRLATVLIAR